VLGNSGEVSASQMAIGFDRMDAVVEDLAGPRDNISSKCLTECLCVALGQRTTCYC
jgi:hypothetical protein